MNNTISAPTPKSKVQVLALVGLMSAVICLLGPLSLEIPISPVPISLGFLAIYFVVSVLGLKLGTLSVIIYILLGLVGLPVFTGFMGGPGKLLGPTGGYIIGYIFMAPICGFFVDRWSKKLPICFLGMVLGSVVCYFFGTLWLAYQSSYTFFQAFAVGVLPYIIPDLIKLIVALAVGSQLRSRLVKAGLL